jgi:hypothetical protein
MAVVWLYLHADANPQARNRNNERTFGNIANNRGFQNRYGIDRANVHSFSNGQEILDAVSRYTRIEKLIIFCHGYPDQLGWSAGRSGGGGISDRYRRRQQGWVPLRQFTQLLGPKLVQNAVIGLAACSCGLGRTEWRNLTNRKRAGESQASIDFKRSQYYDIRGADSFAAVLRNQLSAFTNVEVRAHISSGSAIHNPQIISFSSPANSAGFLHIRDLLENPPDNLASHILQWQRSGGPKYEGWILGETVAEFSTRGRRAGSQASIFPSNTTNPNGPSEVSSHLPPGDQPISIPSNLGSEAELYNQLEQWAREMEENITETIL